jgi:hypothetical protein
VAEGSEFGELLVRLSTRRELDIGVLSRQVGISEADFRRVAAGAMPHPSLIRRLAPELNLHAADLFVMAEMAVPDDLAPLDVKAGKRVPDLVRQAISLSPEFRHQLLYFVRSLPQQERGQPVPTPREWEQYQPTPHAMLVRMLRNRNLDWLGSAKVLALMTGLVFSAATIGQVGHGRKNLSPDLLTGFAIVLGIPVEDLTLLTGVQAAEMMFPRLPAMADAADLIWNVRRLTDQQVRQVQDHAQSMHAK